ncbi:hypothetical protein EYR41_008199 [Orbilia oligospora]|uniref:Uncharacterized protein n=1 Tax=Orbilia oligospora TaxID=2813651 RepID=A0A7C8KIC9_ORBOL|nr:hypothetical protein TWF751_007157 [Orbilia oligospora]KAF3232828.1 hypothetical protein TWF128_003539 [Orbilia oligospora]KAF3237948.1 hypothetical protein TWF217_002019 [Orbilia oligospora]KAF3294090.1 hypothetical protein TWF132_003546 [Orbilia oligospora]TGJ66580.1 hypothetical protein EYR41_008199 [Orbilia oligospora]
MGSERLGAATMHSQGIDVLMNAIRLGEINAVREHLIASKHHLNAVDKFDYSPIGLASLCGHYDILELLLSLGARCDRGTFQGERAVYSALNDRIRNLLLKYDYSVSIDNKQPYATLLSSLLSKEVGCASLTGIYRPRPDGDTFLHPHNSGDEIVAHAFVLIARSKYFRDIMESSESLQVNRLPIPTDVNSTLAALRCMYLIDSDDNTETGDTPDSIKLSVYFGLPSLSKSTNTEPRDGANRHTSLIEAAQEDFLRLWDECLSVPLCLPRGEPFSVSKLAPRVQVLRPDVVLKVGSQFDDEVFFYAVHKAMIQSDFICTAVRFKQAFQSSQIGGQWPTVVSIDVSPQIMEAILKWFYTDMVDIPVEAALDLLQAADMLLIERLKSRACLLVTTQDSDDLLTGERGYSIFDVARAGWMTGTFLKLDPFCARFLANRLEKCLEEGTIRFQFEELIRESASRIQKREETDTIELIDDLRYYLSERFRMRFEALPAHMFSDESQNHVDNMEAQTEHTTEVLKTDNHEYERLTGALDELLVKLGFDV